MFSDKVILQQCNVLGQSDTHCNNVMFWDKVILTVNSVTFSDKAIFTVNSVTFSDKVIL